MQVIYTHKELDALLNITARGASLMGKTYPIQSYHQFKEQLIKEGWVFTEVDFVETATFTVPEERSLKVFAVIDKYLKPIVTTCIAIQSMAEVLMGQFDELNRELKKAITR